MKNKLVIELICALLICLFVYAAVSKLLDYPLFVAQLQAHPMLKRFAGFLAWAVPMVELGVVALLVIPGTKLAGLYSAAALLLAFTAYLALMLLTDKNLPCSCGGVINTLTWRQHSIFNGVFILLAVTGIILNKRKDKHKPTLSFRL